MAKSQTLFFNLHQDSNDHAQKMSFQERKPSSPLATVVIVNYNGGEMICRCLAALERQSFQEFETVVVDNNSTDGSLLSIRKDYPQVIVFSLPMNLGFAGGVNHALHKHSLGPWVVLLNPDAFPTQDWLASLLASAQSHPEYAAFGSRMFSDQKHQVLDGIGDVYHVCGLPWRDGHGSLDSSLNDQEKEIFAPCAAAAMYSVTALREVGLFDEEFFLYVEDVDLGFRLRLAGYRALYVPAARVHHVGSALVGKHSEFQIYYGHRNLVWVYIKDMPGILFWMFLPLHVALNIVSVIWFVLRGNGAVILRAKRDALRGVPRFWQKRLKIQTSRNASIWSILAMLKWSPFGRGFGRWHHPKNQCKRFNAWFFTFFK